MRGTVVHFRGKFRRSLERRGPNPRVKVEITLPESLDGELVEQRPAHYAFFIDDELFAYSRKVSLRAGRRYSQVEHWFVCADDIK